MWSHFKRKFSICMHFHTVLSCLITYHQLGFVRTDDCGSGWTVHGDNCYQLSDKEERFDWNSSQSQCLILGGNLVSILDKNEMDFITQRWGADGDRFWTGLRFIGMEREPVWVDELPFVFDNFQDENSNTDQEICTSINTEDGSWKREHCNEEMKYICKKNIGKATAIPSTPTTPLPGFCSSGWSAFKNKCYRISKDQKRWAEAYTSCMTSGAQLVSISDKKEQGFLVALLGQEDDPETVWIGLENKILNEFSSWVDGTKVEFTNWLPQRPKAITPVTDHKCVEMSNTALKAGRWKDIGCLEKRRFICQKPKSLTEQSQCDAKGLVGFQSYRKGCYHLMDVKLSWQKAEESCKKNYKGHLASITNVFEQAFLTSYLTSITDEVWIGYSSSLDNDFKWSDGWPTYLTNWGKDEPKDNGKDDQCVVYNSDLYWEVRDCDKETFFICKVTDEKPPEIEKVSGECPTNSKNSVKWIDTGFKNCYMIDYNTSVTWGEASETCQNLGGNLTSFHSPLELDSLQPHIQESESHMWIGLEKNEHGSYDWVDGTPSEFRRWDVDEPSPQEYEKCVELYAHNMMFNNAKCYSKRGFICATNKVPSKPIPTVPTSNPNPTVPSGNCPAGWIQFESEENKIKKCYQFNGVNELTRKNWAEALEACGSMGPDHQLLTINSEDEQMFLTSQMYRLKTPAWIGMRFTNTTSFHWIDNSSESYVNWDPSIHDINPDQCIGMLENTVRAGMWREKNCSIQQSYICQRLPDPKQTDPITPQEPDCRQGYVGYRTSCYKLMQTPGDRVTWDKAEENCTKDGGHLTSINSPYDAAFLYTQIDKHSTTADGKLVLGYWIGLKDMDDNHILQWIDGWPVYFSDWSSGEPKTSKSHRCVFLDVKSRDWTTSSCESQYGGYICKISADSPPPVPEINNGVCPPLTSSWLNVGGQHCYDVHLQNATWGDAYVTCNEYGAALASFHSQHEVDLLESYMKKAEDGLWIGLVKKYDGGFEWKDDSPVDFVNWADSYPKDEKDYQCVKIAYRKLEWMNQGCSQKLGFICKIKKIAENGGLTTTEIAATIVGVTLGVIMLTSIMSFLYKHYIAKGKDMTMRHLTRYSTSGSNEYYYDN